MIAWLGKSIQRKVFFSYIGIFFVTYSSAAVVIFTSISQTIRHTEAVALTQIANQKLGQISSILEALNTNLNAWSRLGVMNDIFSGDIDKRISRTLNQLHTQYSLSGELYVFNKAGQFVAGSSMKNSGWTLPAVWKIQRGDVKFIDKYIPPPAPGQDIAKAGKAVIVISRKIFANFNAGKQIGTIVATVPWINFYKIILDGNLSTLLVKKGEKLLLFSTNHFSKNFKDVSFLDDKPLELSIMGQDYVAGYANVHTSNIADWSMVTLETKKESNQPLGAIAIKLLLLGIALLIPLGLIIRWLSLLLTRPLHSLERTVSSVARKKDLSLRANITTHDEIGRLGHAFNDMAENLAISAQEKEDARQELEALNITLEKRVINRTSELKVANTEITHAFEQLKSTQSQLVHSEKMASLGQLVAGVAHELNNPIGFIYANFPHLAEYADEIFQLLDDIGDIEMPESSKTALASKIAEYDIDFIKNDLHEIIASGKSGATRIKEIVSSLKSFSRLDEGDLKNIILEKGIDDTLAILNYHLKDRIEVEKHYHFNELVLCRAGQINQVFTNIIFNAIQAMGDNGKLIIITRSIGENVQVSIRDNGKGIPAKIIDRIFDPFFTTKKIGEGTGLGLSISYGIIESQGGDLRVVSTVGEGTTFTIELPRICSEENNGKE